MHLVGMELVMLHFAGDMSMWGFSSSNSDAQLHVQSTYRLTFNDITILCQNDINRLDGKYILIYEERDLLNLYAFPMRVINVCIMTNQDLRIDFENGFILYIYADLHATNEQWRFWEVKRFPWKERLCFVAVDSTIKILRIHR